MDKEQERHFETGAKRHDATDKPKLSLMPINELYRVLEIYRYGAERFGADNWKLGMPVSEFIDSAFRHLTALLEGKVDEDHGARTVWNIMCAMWMIKNKPEQDDRKKPVNLLDRTTTTLDPNKLLREEYADTSDKDGALGGAGLYKAALWGFLFDSATHPKENGALIF